MKKTLIALAVAGVVAAPAAMAEVTVYGQAHVSIGNNNNGDKSTTVVASNSSRVGVKASEALDGGLTAVAQYEFGVAVDEAGTLSGRNQFVGLAGGFGTVLAGRHDAPIKMSTGAMDVFADTIADYNTIVGVNGASDVRADNAIAYVAPAMAGATIVLAYVPDESATANSDAISAAVMWGQGPLAVNVGYLSTGKDFDLGNTAGGFIKDGLAGTAAEITNIRAGVGYQVTDALKVGFIYETLEGKTAGGTAKFKDYLLNASFGLGGGNTVKAEYGMLDPDGGDNNSTLLAVGLDHAFSKTTSAYVVYASLANDDGAAAQLGVVGPGETIKPAAGKDPNAIQVGMVVKF